jgi:hypothetical protein
MNLDNEVYLELKKAIYGKKSQQHPHLRKVNLEQAFRLKRNSHETISEIFSLEDLLKAIERAPEDALIFHMKNGKNDFASWVEEIFENEVLSKKFREITLKEENPEETRWKLVGALYNEIAVLRALSQLHSNNLR